ncbi:MAG: hypothetical protein HY981_03665 [Candidatus Magasanikbacteria bacterium]|nr:hypothetical protein [Candidatus Magasanikbacteria bacterium]
MRIAVKMAFGDRPITPDGEIRAVEITSNGIADSEVAPPSFNTRTS